MKPSDLSEFFSLLGKAKKEKEEEFDNLLKEADINLDDLTSSLVSGIKEAKEDQKKQKKNEEKLIEQLDSIIDVIENPKEVKDITEPAVTVGVPEDFDVSKLEEEDALDVQDWNGGKDVKFTEVDAVDIIKPEPIKTPEISDTVAQAIKFIEETNIKEEIENSDETNLDKLKTEIKQVRDILYKVLAHGPGSGEVNLLKLDDVDTTDLGDEKVLSYDASTEKLKFVEQSGGSGVSTENVRTGILDVAGIATFRNNTLVGTGITLSPDGDIFVTGVTTATKFVGDGSGLTGITASGSGVVIQDEGSAIGTAATINFIGSNVTAALSGGIANVTVTPGITTANVRTGILDVAGIATFRNDTLIGSGVTLSPDGDVFTTGVTTSSSFVGDLTGDVTGTASNATQLNSQAASYYLDYDNFSNTPTIPSNNNQLTNGAGFITASDDITGNAATSTKLATARTIAGVSFDGSANISLNNNAITNGAGYITTSFTNTNQLTNGAGFITASDDITGNAATATALANARTIAGVSFDGSANISLNNNAITNGAGYITGSALNASNLSSGTIPDARFPSTLPAIDGSALTGIAVTDNIRTNTNATFLQNVNVSGTTTATTFIGNLTGNVTGNVSGTSGSTTGNAATATALANARTIGGVSFDGSSNIDLPGVNSAGNQDTTGNAATATKLAATKTIAGVAFDGSSNISLNNNAITNGAGYITATLTDEEVQDKVGAMFTGNTETGITATYQDADGTIDLVVGTLNQDTTGNAATATALETARNIGGVSFDGSSNIDLPGVNSAGNQNTTGTSAGLTGTPSITVNAVNGATGTFSGNVTIGGVLTYEDVTNVDSIGVITARSGVLVGSGITLSPDGDIFTVGVSTFSGNILPGTDSSHNIGSNSVRFANVYGDALHGVIQNTTHTNITRVGTLSQLAVSGTANPLNVTHTSANCVNLNRGSKSIGIDVNYDGSDTHSLVSLTTGMDLRFKLGGADRIVFKSAGHIEPQTDSQINLGSNTVRFANVYADTLYGDGSNLTGITQTTISGNAATATALETARNIGGVSFDGSANIDLPGVNSSGNQNTSGTAAGLSGTPNISCGTVAGSTGTFTTGITTSLRSNKISVGDNERINVGLGSDVQLYWTGSAGFLTNQGGGNLHFNSDTVLIKNAANSKSYIRAYNNSSVEIFHNNNKKFETAKTGAVVTGILTATSFEDGNGIGINTANVRTGILDVAGVSTFRDNINLPDNVELKLGSAGEVRLLHNGSATNFIVSQHYFNMQANGYNLYSQNGSESIITAFQNGAVNLFFDNTKRFETTNTGAVVTGILTATSNVNVGSGVTLSPDGDGFFTGVTTSITSSVIGSNTSPLTIGAVSSHHLTVANDNASMILGKSNSDALYLRRNFATGRYVFQTYSGGNDGLLGLQPFGGKVGIASAIPTSTLDVNGDVRVGSGITLSPDGDIFATGVTTSTTFVGALTGDVTGNADTATTLATARNIGGVSFDGSANIDLPGVNSAGNQNTSGTAAGLSGTPNISCGTIAGSTGSFSSNVGIATNSPQTKLHITQGTDNNTDGIRLSRSNSAASYSQYIDTSSRFNIGYSNPNTADPDPQITLRQNGRVGIGTNVPDTLLHLYGSSQTEKLITLGGGGSKRNNYIGITGSDNLEIGADEDSEGSSSSIRFRVDGSERVRITSGGQVNIGDDFTQTTYKTQIEATDNNVLRLVNDSDDTNGVELVLYKDSASPADGDGIGGIYFQGNDDGGNSVFYANIEGFASDVSDGTEDGYIRFRTRLNGSIGERVRIDSQGDMGIGTNDPQAKLHISSGNSGDCELIIEADSDNNTETDNPRILFRQDGGQDESMVGMDNNTLILANSVSSSGGIVFKTGTTTGYTNAIERMRILDSGGLTFNGGTAAAEAVDDYEEGTFTPTYTTSNNDIGSVNYDVRTGRYTKIGRMVYFTLRMRTDSISDVGSGTIKITGFPYTHKNSASHRAVTNNIYSAGWTVDDAPTLGLFIHNQDALQLYQKDFDNDSGSLPSSSFNTGANDNDVRITGFYESNT